MPSWNRPKKNQARDLAMPNKLVSSTIWLAGKQTMDYNQAMELGLLDGLGNHIIVERDKAIAKKIEQKIEGFNPKPSLYVGELSNLPLKRGIDYAHFDFLGGLTIHTARWFQNLKILTGGELNFVFCESRERGNPLIRAFENLLKEREDFRKICETELKKNNRKEADTLSQARRISLYISILRCIFNKYDFQVLKPLVYADCSTKMVLYRFRNFSKSRKKKYPDFFFDDNELILKSPVRKERKKMSKNSPASKNLEKLIDKFFQAGGNYDKMRGFKRSLTLYCRNRSKETGHPEFRFFAAFKMRITKLGGDASLI